MSGKQRLGETDCPGGCDIPFLFQKNTPDLRAVCQPATALPGSAASAASVTRQSRGGLGGTVGRYQAAARSRRPANDGPFSNTRGLPTAMSICVARCAFRIARTPHGQSDLTKQRRQARGRGISRGIMLASRLLHRAAPRQRTAHPGSPSRSRFCQSLCAGHVPVRTRRPG